MIFMAGSVEKMGNQLYKSAVNGAASLLTGSNNPTIMELDSNMVNHRGGYVSSQSN